jgi:DNA polymerase-3 subunit epsilon
MDRPKESLTFCLSSLPISTYLKDKYCFMMASSPRYAIIDVETTGGDPKRERITEIAILLHDGEQVIDRFQSLINPEVPIPDFITRVTGIDNDMVRESPKFYEVARQVVEITEGAVFVAHNARFDYSFVQKEFRRLGYSFARKQLCTVKWSRKLLPHLGSHSLSNLCKALKISNPQAHRAMSDAQATTTLFEHLLHLSQHRDAPHTLSQEVAESKLPPNLSQDHLDRLPEHIGVYYFHDAGGHVIYVGKSTNIRKRVLSHFSAAHRSKRTMEMIDRIHDLSWTETGSELIALLHENEEIKRIQPAYNRAQRRESFKVGVYLEETEAGYLALRIDKYREANQPVGGFAGRPQAEGALTRWGRHYQLCPKLYDMERGPGRCFHHQLRICLGACVAEEAPEAYNQRVRQAVSALSYGRDRMDSFLIVGAGRDEGERSVVYVEQGTYQGHAYLDSDWLNQPPAQILDAIPRRAEQPDVQRIIQGYVKKHPREIMPLPQTSGAERG